MQRGGEQSVITRLRLSWDQLWDQFRALSARNHRRSSSVNREMAAEEFGRCKNG